MAIIYTYPNLPLSSLSADDLLVITNVDANNNNPTKSVTLADIATYVTSTGSGTGTTNKIVKFTDGANGLLGDSIMTESTGLIDLAGQFVSTSSPTLTQAGPVSGIKATLNGTTAAPNVALYGESKNTGSTQADSNYGLYAKGEFEGTGGFTGFAIGGNLEGRYDGTGTNGVNATVYGSYNLARATTAANGTVSYMIGANNLAKLEGANVTATNLQATHSTVELSNGTAGDVIVQILDFDTSGGGTVTGDFSYLQIQNDTMPTVAGTSRAINSKSVLPSLFTGQVEIPLVPTINAHATSKQYVDQQISSVVSGLVFQSTWDASSTPGGNPDLTAADKKVVGHYYVVSVAGSATPNGAGTLPNSWNVGDWCIYVEQGATDRWEKLDQTFVSGAGAAGQVTYWNSQNEVAGDNDLFFDSTNKRLGIGTTSPATVLDVNGGLNADHATFSGQAGRGLLIATKNITNNDDGVVYNAQTSTGEHLFYTNGTEKMRITSAGDVGIGTTTPTAKLEINVDDDGTTDLNALVLKRTWSTATATDRSHGVLFSDFNSSMATIYADRTNSATNFNSDLLFATNTGTNGSSLSTKMIIKNTGNVGIGTDSPAGKLTIADTAFTTTYNSIKGLFFDNSNISSGDENFGAGIEFGKLSTGGNLYKKAAIIPVQSGADSDQMGISFFVANTTTQGSPVIEAMRVDYGGNVGIGTNSPSHRLDLTTSDTTWAAAIKNTDTTNGYGLFLQSAESANKAILGAYSGSSYKFYVRGDGNVGIGTNDPSSQLSIGGNAITTLKPTAVISDTTNGASLTLRGQSPVLFFDGTAAGVPKILMDGQGIEFKTGTLDTQGDVNFSLDSSGDVSIQNTTGSVFNLRRDDTSIVSGDDLGSIFFQGNDPSNPYKSGAAIIGEGDGTWNMGSPNVYPSRLLFQTAKQNTLITAMRISSDQNVGIGTTSNPGAKLEVVNAAEGTYLIAGGDNASNSRALAFTSSSSGVTNGALHTINAQSGNGVIALATAGAERMRINNSGDILFGTTSETNSHAYFSAESNSRMVLSLGAATTSASTIASFKNSNGAVGSISVGGSATSFNTSSDYRLKKDLKDFDGLDKVSKIPVYDFKWKVDDSSSYGVMAHELQEVLPDAVSGEKDGEEMQEVDYSKIVPLLIKSIQELEAKVKILENK